MKQSLLLLGGFIGFAVCFAAGIAAGRDVGNILLSAAVGCMAGGLMFKWISILLMESIAIQRRRSTQAKSTGNNKPGKEEQK